MSFRKTSSFKVVENDKKRAISHFSRLARTYEAHVNRGLLRLLRQRERTAILKEAHLDVPGEWLLDVGCGSGYYSWIGKKNGLLVHAIDASREMLRLVQDIADQTELADIETFQPNRVYDRVICAGVLDFVVDPERAFRNLCRLVNQNGRLIVLAPKRGMGGIYYRLEKGFSGLRVNLYRPSWFEEIAGEFQMNLINCTYPLPTNFVLTFIKKIEVRTVKQVWGKDG